jgi:hypothetical protein
MLLGLGAKTERVNQLQRIAKTVSTGEFAADLAEDLANLVFDGVCARSAFLEAMQIWKQLEVDVLDQVIARECAVMIESPISFFWRGPFSLTVIFINNELIGQTT